MNHRETEERRALRTVSLSHVAHSYGRFLTAIRILRLIIAPTIIGVLLWTPLLLVLGFIPWALPIIILTWIFSVWFPMTVFSRASGGATLACVFVAVLATATSLFSFQPIMVSWQSFFALRETSASPDYFDFSSPVINLGTIRWNDLTEGTTQNLAEGPLPILSNILAQSIAVTVLTLPLLLLLTTLIAGLLSYLRYRGRFPGTLIPAIRPRKLHLDLGFGPLGPIATWMVKAAQYFVTNILPDLSRLFGVYAASSHGMGAGWTVRSVLLLAFMLEGSVYYSLIHLPRSWDDLTIVLSGNYQMLGKLEVSPEPSDVARMFYVYLMTQGREILGHKLDLSLETVRLSLSRQISWLFLYVTTILVSARALLWVGGWLRAWAQRKLIQPLDRLPYFDERPPILFLRSFDDDQISLHDLRKPVWLSLFDAASVPRTLEQVVINTLEPLGPVSAIGNPKDTIVPIGAVREYVPDESWKQVVENLMQKATLIVAGAGTSHGLEWELETVKSLQLLHKTVLLFPPSLADDDGFLQRVLSLLQVSQIVDTPADLEDLSETLEPRNPARRAARNQARQLRYSVGLVFPSGGAPVLLKAQHLSEVEYELALKLLAHTCCASP